MISWREEKAKLLLGHKLEKKRIWWNRGLNFATVAFLALSAYCVGENYASKIRKQEYEYQRQLDVNRERQRVYYEKRVDAYRILDSLYSDASWSFYMGGINYANDSGANAISRYRERLRSDIYETQITLNKYYPFISRTYHDLAREYCILLSGASQTEVSIWPDRWTFIKQLQISLENVVRNEYEILTGVDKVDSAKNYAIIPDIPEARLVDILTSKELAELFEKNFDIWQRMTKPMYRDNIDSITFEVKAEKRK